MKILNKIMWNKVKVNEIFVWKLEEKHKDIEIYCKMSNRSALYLANNFGEGAIPMYTIGKQAIDFNSRDDNYLYKLSKSVQKLFKEE